MKSLSLKRLYILSALKSSIINLLVLCAVSFVAIKVINNQQVKSLADSLVFSNTELEQVNQFKLYNNKDGLDLYLISKKENKSLNKIEVINDVSFENCSNEESYIVCHNNGLRVYQELPLSKGSYLVLSHVGIESTYGSMLFLLCFVIFIFNIVTSYFSNVFAQNEIKKQISNIENGDESSKKIVEFERLEEIITKANENLINQSITQSNIKIIKKLQHDVQSPMTTLEYFFNEARKNLKEDLRLLGRQSINRINDIINTLRVNDNDTILEESLDKETIAIYPILKRIVSEKRNEYKNRMDVQINLDPTDNVDHFVDIRISDFYRTLSNIINNSIEAKKDNNDICINVNAQAIENSIEITISDNGKGIDKKYLEDVFEYGMSIDKETGSGIGLYQAKEYIESEGGQVLIDSCIEQGTILKITLSKAKAPKWYSTNVEINTTKVVIVDDDDSIHNLWTEKLNNLGIKTIHFKNSSDFEAWAKDNNLNEYNYLFDLDLIGSELDGLELISAYNLQARSILVTSHFMSRKIQNKCNRIGVKMIPKESVVNLKVLKRIADRPKEIVLIDDDIFTHMNWKKRAKDEGIDLHGFESIEAFLDNKDKFQLHTPIYIDSNLGNGIKGEVASEKIYQEGFKELILATGMNESDIEVPFWIKEVQGKGFHV